MDLKLVASKIYEKGKMFLRGELIRRGFKKSGNKILIGKNTSIKHKRNIIIGSNVTINDYTEINAEVKDSVVIGNNSNIGKYSVIKCTGTYKNSKSSIIIGNDFCCGDFCFFGCAGGIRIGNDVIMGQSVRFHAQNHIFDKINILIREQGTTQRGIIIDDDCWIGAGTVFLDGVKVGKGCVIGANTVVTRDIEPYSVAVGNPCRIIRKRN